jgi:hypothetical protein
VTTATEVIRRGDVVRELGLFRPLRVVTIRADDGQLLLRRRDGSTFWSPASRVVLMWRAIA